MVGLEEKILKTKVLRWLENAILTVAFANTLNAFLHTSYRFFQQIKKHYIALSSPKLIYF